MGRRGQWRVWLVAVAAAAALAFVAWDYARNRDALLRTIGQETALRALSIGQHVQSMAFNVLMARDLMLRSWRSASSGGTATVQPEFVRLRDFPELGVFGLPDGKSVDSNLTGAGHLGELDERLIREINAALSLRPLFEMAVEQDSAIIWAYYTSARRFIFIAPWSATADNHFSEQLYQAAFWTQAVPHANPDRRLVATDLYQDVYGAGWMITLSAPVVDEGTFLGVVSMDIGLDFMNRIATQADGIFGESLVVNENGNIVAGPPGRTGTPIAAVLPSGYSSFASLSALRGLAVTPAGALASYPVLPGRLRFVHVIARGAILRATLLYILPDTTAVLAVVALLGALLRLQQLIGQVRHQASLDPLTAALTRRAFAERVDVLLAAAARYGHPVSFVMLDIDHFKKVNDSYGHAVGDAVLKALTQVCGDGLRKPDLLGRYGGEELLIGLPYTDLAGAVRLAERLRLAVARLRVGSVSITASFGCAEAAPGEPLEAVVRRADQALYAAKAAGRNRVESQPPLPPGQVTGTAAALADAPAGGA